MVSPGGEVSTPFQRIVKYRSTSAECNRREIYAGSMALGRNWLIHLGDEEAEHIMLVKEEKSWNVL